MRKQLFTIAGAGALAAAFLSTGAHAQTNQIIFSMAASAGAATCLPGVAGRVTVNKQGDAENLHVEITHLPPNTEFDFFLIQVPKAPFGLSWYQGDISTDIKGIGVGDFRGRFNKETFIVAPGVAPAPVVFHNAPFPDANTNPQTGPVHTYHLGVWFDNPADAAKAGCAGTVTPFNGIHHAGIQVLNTANFPDLLGPLIHLP